MMNESTRRTRRGGFTLIEIILVVVIISLMAAVVLPRVVGYREDASVGAARAQIAAFRTALGQFEMAANRYPSTEEGLRALVERPAALPQTVNWRRYLDEQEIPRDPWGNEYVYRYPGTVNTDGYDLFSMGPDGQPGTDDDIGNTVRRRN